MRASASSVSQALSNSNSNNSNTSNNSNSNSNSSSSSSSNSNSNNNSNSNSNSNSNRVLNLQFPPAEQPDIVRAAQKDDFYKRLFSDQCYDLVGRMVGARYSLQHQGVVRLLAESVYYALNTLSGPDQTLGEEYCDILMVQPRGGVQVPPGVLTRVVQVGWHVVVPYLAGRVAERGTGYLQALAAGSSMAASLVPKLLPAIRGLAPKLQRLHLALFYFDGKFYDFSKRLSNIHYVFNGKVDQRRPKYHILGALILIQFAVSLLIYMREKLGILRKLNHQIEDLSEASQEPEEDKGQATNANKCTLCLEPRTNTTATLCGHLFCWNCITEWCNNKAECPLCRRPLTLQSLVCVYHYQ